ncbi:thioredoxin domain-containing protein [Bacteriovoracaceae bacterium]|nr:thioredoxin domain-containing protein [Bacteriovoracaceae bacterium]
MEETNFFKKANTTQHLIYSVSALAMIALGIYLTNHYYAVKFPEGLAPTSMCDINSYFNCDIATHSKLSNIAGIPISIFGMMIGFIAMFGYMFQNPRFEKTLTLFLTVNFIGCVSLFLYSLIALGGLCPFCFLYYVFSSALFFLLFKRCKWGGFDPLYFLSFGVIILIAAGISFSVTNSKMEKISKIAPSLIGQFNNLKNLGAPSFESEYRLASATEKFEDAPIQITKFSDFECPACKALSEQFHSIMKEYKGKINIQYFFFPLDHNCNPAIQRPLHVNACNATYLSVCLPEKFPVIEKELFDNQANFSKELFLKIAKREGVLECFESKETKDKVAKYLGEAKPFNVSSTPTFILNGKKIEGVLPTNQIKILLDEVLRASNK